MKALLFPEKPVFRRSFRFFFWQSSPTLDLLLRIPDHIVEDRLLPSSEASFTLALMIAGLAPIPRNPDFSLWTTIYSRRLLVTDNLWQAVVMASSTVFSVISIYSRDISYPFFLEVRGSASLKLL